MFLAAMSMISSDDKSNDDEDGTIGSVFDGKQGAVVRSLRFLRDLSVAIEIVRRGKTSTFEKCSISLMVVLSNREWDQDLPSAFFVNRANVCARSAVRNWISQIVSSFHVNVDIKYVCGVGIVFENQSQVSAQLVVPHMEMIRTNSAP
jgi:hypothetical protein